MQQLFRTKGIDAKIYFLNNKAIHGVTEIETMLKIED